MGCKWGEGRAFGRVYIYIYICRYVVLVQLIIVSWLCIWSSTLDVLPHVFPLPIFKLRGTRTRSRQLEGLGTCARAMSTSEGLARDPVKRRLFLGRRLVQLFTGRFP